MESLLRSADIRTPSLDVEVVVCVIDSDSRRLLAEPAAPLADVDERFSVVLSACRNPQNSRSSARKELHVLLSPPWNIDHRWMARVWNRSAGLEQALPRH